MGRLVSGLNSASIYQDRDGYYFHLDGDVHASEKRFDKMKTVEDEAYIQIAIDHYGSAIRDSTRDEKIAMGLTLDEGDTE